MSDIGEVNKRTRGLIMFQIGAAVIVAIAFFALRDMFSAWSAIYGVLVSMSGTLLLSFDVRRATKRAATNPKNSLGILYFGAVQRFVLILVLLVVGLALLKLDAVPTLVGFAVAQLAFVSQFKKLAQP